MCTFSLRKIESSWALKCKVDLIRNKQLKCSTFSEKKKKNPGALQTTRKGRKVNAQQEKTSKIHKCSCIYFNNKVRIKVCVIKIIHAKLIMCLIFPESDLFCSVVLGEAKKRKIDIKPRKRYGTVERECNVFLTLWASNDLCGLLTFLCLMRKSSLLY